MCKGILRDANNLVTELKQSNDTLNESIIKSTLEKVNYLKEQNYEPILSQIKRSNQILSKMNEKKQIMEELNNLLMEEEDLTILPKLTELKEKAFEDLSIFKTDHPLEKDINDLATSQIQYLEGLNDLENSIKKEEIEKQKKLEIKLEELIFSEKIEELRNFLKEHQKDLTKEKYKYGKDQLFKIENADEIKLQNYLKEKTTELEKSKSNRSSYNDSSSNTTPEFKIEETTSKLEKLSVKSHTRTLSATDKKTEKGFETNQRKSNPDIIVKNNDFPTNMKKFHRSVVDLAKLQVKITLKEDTKEMLEQLIQSIIQLLQNDQNKSFFSGTKSIIDIFNMLDTNFITKFYKTKGYWITMNLKSNKQEDIIKTLIRYSLHKRRIVNFIREIMDNKEFKTIYSEKSPLKDSIIKNEMNVTLDLLEKIIFEFEDFEDEKDSTELKVPEDKRVVSKKKKTKKLANNMKEIKRIVQELEMVKSKVKKGEELPKKFDEIVLNEFLPTIESIISTGLKKGMNPWNVIFEITKTDKIFKDKYEKLKQHTKNANDSNLFESFIVLFINQSDLDGFLTILQNNQKDIEQFYEGESVISNEEYLKKLENYFIRMNNLSLKISI